MEDRPEVLPEDSVKSPRPAEPGDIYTTIAPECFTDGNVISYKGEQYYRACDHFVSDRDEGGQTFCVKRVRHPGLFHEDYDGRQKLVFESDGQMSRDELKIIWPRLYPSGDPVTKADVKATWDEYIVPMKTSGKVSEEMPIEARTLMAIMRHVYGAMPEDEE